MQAGKLIAAPADTPAPVSKSQSPRISSSQSRCRQLRSWSPRAFLIIAFYLALATRCLFHSTLILCRGAAAQRAASKIHPEEKGPQGNMKPQPRIQCKWLSNMWPAIITTRWSFFLSKSSDFIRYLKKKQQHISQDYLRKEVKMFSHGLKTNLHYLQYCKRYILMEVDLKCRYTLYFCNIIFCSACLIIWPKHTLGT